MKNFDIDSLKRENIYTKPSPTFFKDMQDRVLQETTYKAIPISSSKRKKIIPFNWNYGVAASLLLMMSVLGFYQWQEMEVVRPLPLDSVEAIYGKTEAVKIDKGQVIEDDNSKSPEIIEESNMNKDEKVVQVKAIPKNEISQEKPKKVAKPAAKTKKTKKNTITNSDVDDLLDAFTEEDVNNILGPTESDVYLDLYN